MMRENLKNIYKSAAATVSSLNAFRENLKSLNKNIVQYKEEIDPDDDAYIILRDALVVMSKVHDKMLSTCTSNILSFLKKIFF